MRGATWPRCRAALMPGANPARVRTHAALSAWRRRQHRAELGDVELDEAQRPNLDDDSGAPYRSTSQATQDRTAANIGPKSPAPIESRH